MSDYPMLISNKLHSFRNFNVQTRKLFQTVSFGRLVAVGMIQHPYIPNSGGNSNL